MTPDPDHAEQFLFIMYFCLINEKNTRDYGAIDPVLIGGGGTVLPQPSPPPQKPPPPI